MSLTSPAGARLWRPFPTNRPAGIVLLLHGGSETGGHRTGDVNPALLRLWPLAWSLSRRVPNVQVCVLKFSCTGWGSAGAEVQRDARWALEVTAARWPGVPIVVVGHSLGARVAFLLAGAARVIGVVAVAPWAVAGDPVAQLADRPVEVVHGDRDRSVPDPGVYLAAAGAAGAHVHTVVVLGAGHLMLRKMRQWNRFTACAVRAVLEGPA